MILAVQHNWTPEQIARLDGEYVEELLARHRAESAVARAAEARSKRRHEAAKRRQTRYGDAEDADVE